MRHFTLLSLIIISSINYIIYAGDTSYCYETPNILWEKKFYPVKINEIFDIYLKIYEPSNGNIILTYGITEKLNNDTAGDNLKNGFIEIDNMGNIIKRKEFSTAGTPWFHFDRSEFIENNNSYIFLGQEVDKRPWNLSYYPEFLHTDKDYNLINFYRYNPQQILGYTSSFGKLWNDKLHIMYMKINPSKYQYNRYYDIVNSDRTLNKTIFLDTNGIGDLVVWNKIANLPLYISPTTFITNLLGPGTTHSGNSTYSLWTRYDTSGKVLSHNKIQLPGYLTTIIHESILLPNGNVFSEGSMRRYNDGTGSIDVFDNLMIETDTMGNIVWHEIFNYYIDTLKKREFLSNSNKKLLGGGKYFAYCGSNYFQDQKILLKKEGFGLALYDIMQKQMRYFVWDQQKLDQDANKRKIFDVFLKPNGNVIVYGLMDADSLYIAEIDMSPTSAEEKYPSIQDFFTIAPNPASDILEITLTDENGLDGITFEIYDISGRSMLRAESDGNPLKRLNVAALPVGSYLLSGYDRIRGRLQSLKFNIAR